jgi:hypothetical protein
MIHELGSLKPKPNCEYRRALQNPAVTPSQLAFNALSLQAKMHENALKLGDKSSGSNSLDQKTHPPPPPVKTTGPSRLYIENKEVKEK